MHTNAHNDNPLPRRALRAVTVCTTRERTAAGTLIATPTRARLMTPAITLVTALVTTLMVSLATPHAHAVEYNQVQAAGSSITFRYQQMGVDMDGKFGRFNSRVSFDPAQPAKASASIDIDLASIDTGVKEADEEATGKAWFNTKAHPTASFVSSGVKPLGNNRYAVSGKLSIKGKTQEIVVPASFTAQGKSGSFDGSFTIRRSDFAIGEGAWAKFDIVANDIVVKFRIVASAK